MLNPNKYKWPAADFSEFKQWAEINQNPDKHYPLEFLVIDWVIQCSKNKGKKFFGISLGSNPYQAAFAAASEFSSEYGSWLKRESRSEHKSRLEDAQRKKMYEAGHRDGYFSYEFPLSYKPVNENDSDYYLGHQHGWNRHRQERCGA